MYELVVEVVVVVVVVVVVCRVRLQKATMEGERGDFNEECTLFCTLLECTALRVKWP